jgi:hypothetical protein
VKTDAYDTERHVGDDAREPAMGATGTSLTVWAACRAAGRGELDDKLLLIEAHEIELEPGPVGKDGRKERGNSHEGHSNERG